MIKTKNIDSRWVALDIHNHTIIISEGKTPNEVIESADKKGKEYILSFNPNPDIIYIL